MDPSIKLTNFQCHSVVWYHESAYQIYLIKSIVFELSSLLTTLHDTIIKFLRQLRS